MIMTMPVITVCEHSVYNACQCDRRSQQWYCSSSIDVQSEQHGEAEKAERTARELRQVKTELICPAGKLCNVCARGAQRNRQGARVAKSKSRGGIKTGERCHRLRARCNAMAGDYGANLTMVGPDCLGLNIMVRIL